MFYWCMVRYFRYPNLLPHCSVLEMDELSNKFNDFVMLEEDNIAFAVREEAKVETSDGDIEWT